MLCVDTYLVKYIVVNAELSGHNFSMAYTDEHNKKDLELPLLELSRIIKATNNFSFQNKLGEGGFGPVYKVIKYISSLCYDSQIDLLFYFFQDYQIH